MWILSWKKYALSKFATFVSILGTLTRYAGVMCLFSGVIPAALICIAIGVGLHFAAEAIAKNKAAKVAGKANAAKTANPAPSAAKAAPAQPAPKQKKCIRCGANIDSSKFCSECGYDIK